MAIIDFFDRGWSINPDGIAYSGAEEQWTFQQAGSLTYRIAHALIDHGVGAGTKVAVLSPNAPLAWISVLGIWRTGAAWVPLNPQVSAKENADLVSRFDVEILLYHPSMAEAVEGIRRDAPAIRECVALGADAPEPSLQTWLTEKPETRPGVDYSMEDVVVVAPTGGTTGAPKGVMNTNRSLSVMVSHLIMALPYPAGTPIVNLAATPMTHTAGLLSLHATARGGTVHIIDRASAEGVLNAIEAREVTDLFLPPTVIYRLLSELEGREIDTTSLRYLINGAAPMSTDKLRAGIDRLGPVFVEGYGQMEAPAAISFLQADEHLQHGMVAPENRLGSCGRPAPMVTVKITEPNSGEELSPGETGEVCVRGDLVMKGYYKDAEKTAETIVDGWLLTGDLGHIDKQGYIHITDRKKDVIISGGFNVYPTEVEQVIWTHPAVMDCAVVGNPHEDWGEEVTAIVELHPDQAVDERELIDLCRQNLGPVRTPKRIIFMDRLIRSVNGKVLKKDLREMLRSGELISNVYSDVKA